MVEAPKVAKQLYEFFQAADKKKMANAAVRIDYPRYSGTENAPDRILKIYEECVAKLPNDEDRAKLADIIEQMPRTLNG